MKHNIIPKALRWTATAGLVLAAAACNKDSIVSENIPQEGVTPTKIIFNVTRSGYVDDAETRAPKSEWKEGDVVWFGVLKSEEMNKATYTGGEWVVDMKYSISGNNATLAAVYGEYMSQSPDYERFFYFDENGDVAYTNSGSYQVSEGGVATITLSLDQHPQGRMTFTGVGKGKELVVRNMTRVFEWECYIDPMHMNFIDLDSIILVGEEDGTATLYALPTADIVTEAGITLTVKYDGFWYTKTFSGKEFKENSNITLAAPSLEGGWEEAAAEYGAADLKLGDYLYSDGTTSDGGLRKLYPDGTIEATPETVAPVAGKTVIGIVFHVDRYAKDTSDYTKPLTTGGPTLTGEVRGYAVAVADATFGNDAAWVLGPNGEYRFTLDISTDKYDWNGYANCQVMHDYVTAHAGEGWEMRHFQAAWSCETYGNRTLDYDGKPTSDYAWQAPLKAPAGTSGWFLPSCGQLLYMQDFHDYINEHILAAKKAASNPMLNEYVDKMSPYTYYSSTLSGAELFAWGVSKDSMSGLRRDMALRTRPVIVF